MLSTQDEYAVLLERLKTDLFKRERIEMYMLDYENSENSVYSLPPTSFASQDTDDQDIDGGGIIYIDLKSIRLKKSFSSANL